MYKREPSKRLWSAKAGDYNQLTRCLYGLLTLILVGIHNCLAAHKNIIESDCAVAVDEPSALVYPSIVRAVVPQNVI